MYALSLFHPPRLAMSHTEDKGNYAEELWLTCSALVNPGYKASRAKKSIQGLQIVKLISSWQASTGMLEAQELSNTEDTQSPLHKAEQNFQDVWSCAIAPLI